MKTNMTYKPEALQRKIIVELENAMFHSLTTMELAQELATSPQKVRRAALVLRDSNVISELRTNDRGSPYRYFLMHVPVQEEISMEPAPQVDTPPTWWRRVVGWIK